MKLKKRILTLLLTTLLTISMFTVPASAASTVYPPGQYTIPFYSINGIYLPTGGGKYDVSAFGSMISQATLGSTNYFFHNRELDDLNKRKLLSIDYFKIPGIGYNYGQINTMSGPLISGSSDSIVLNFSYNGGRNYGIPFNLHILGNRYNEYNVLASTSAYSSTLDYSKATITFTILPDTTAVGRIESSVQTLPIILNNAVNNMNTNLNTAVSSMNTSLNNKVSGVIYVPRGNPGTKLTDVGLTGTITTNGTYTTPDKTATYRVVFYDPPTNIAQLNLS